MLLSIFQINTLTAQPVGHNLIAFSSFKICGTAINLIPELKCISPVINALRLKKNNGANNYALKSRIDKS